MDCFVYIQCNAPGHGSGGSFERCMPGAHVCPCVGASVWAVWLLPKVSGGVSSVRGVIGIAIQLAQDKETASLCPISCFITLESVFA